MDCNACYFLQSIHCLYCFYRYSIAYYSFVCSAVKAMSLTLLAAKCSLRCNILTNKPAVNHQFEQLRERYTLSTNTPTDGSIPVLLVPLPKARMAKLVFTERCNGVTRKVGTSVCRSFMSITLVCSIALLFTTVTVTGDSCKPFKRLDAITKILSISLSALYYL